MPFVKIAVIWPAIYLCKIVVACLDTNIGPDMGPMKTDDPSV